MRRGQQQGLAASILDRLLDDDPRAGDPHIDSLDLKNASSLLKKLLAVESPLCRYIVDRCPTGDRMLLNAYDGAVPLPPAIFEALIRTLNGVIFGPFLYEHKRFEGVQLKPETIKLMEDSRKTKNPPIYNRILLDEAYSDELEKMRNPVSFSLSMRELKKTISRDIELLLNTRRQLVTGVVEQHKEIQRSILMYGLPDFSNRSLLNVQDRKFVRRSVEESLATFEPRLKSVRVTVEEQAKFDPTLRFRIDALLRTDPAPEPIALDAALNLATSEYSVRSDD